MAYPGSLKQKVISTAGRFSAVNMPLYQQDPFASLQSLTLPDPQFTANSLEQFVNGDIVFGPSHSTSHLDVLPCCPCSRGWFVRGFVSPIAVFIQVYCGRRLSSSILGCHEGCCCTCSCPCPLVDMHMHLGMELLSLENVYVQLPLSPVSQLVLFRG